MITVRKIDGFVVPANDPFFGTRGGLLKHQRSAMEAISLALLHIQRSKVAVDIGAHIGTWTVPLADQFEQVVAFEPTVANFTILQANAADLPNVRLFPLALGPKALRVALQTPNEAYSSLGYCVEANGSLEEPWAPCIALDSLNLPQLDLLKIDVEGLECEVIEGARQTIERCRPVVVFEDNVLAGRFGHERGDAQKMLEAMGLSEVGRCEFLPDMYDVVMSF